MKILRFNGSQPIFGTASDSILKRFTIKQVAEVITPEGEPFWIIDELELPEDKTFIDAIDPPDREPDGYGSSATTFWEALDD